MLDSILFVIVTLSVSYFAIGLVLHLNAKWRSLQPSTAPVEPTTPVDDFLADLAGVDLLPSIEFVDSVETVLSVAEVAIALVDNWTQSQLEICETDIDTLSLSELRTLAESHGLDGSRLNRNTLRKRLKQHLGLM